MGDCKSTDRSEAQGQYDGRIFWRKNYLDFILPIINQIIKNINGKIIQLKIIIGVLHWLIPQKAKFKNPKGEFGHAIENMNRLIILKTKVTITPIINPLDQCGKFFHPI